MITRRVFVGSLAGGLFPAPLAAEAQQAWKVHKIGFLRSGRPPEAWIAEFQQGLRERGYVDGQNIVIEYRFWEGSLDQFPRIVEEMARLNVDVILASGGPAAVAAQKVTRSLPIVFVGVNGPLELGLVTSLGHPGGNITGLAITSSVDMVGKRLELLRDPVPNLRRVAVLWRPENPGNQVQLKAAEAAAPVLNMQLQPLPLSSPGDFDAAFNAARGANALLVVDDPLFVTHRTRVVKLAASARLPAIYGFREFVDSGGLMSYGVYLQGLYRRAATYVDKILRGANPADLPVEQPTTYELIVNRKIAKALGLTNLQSLLMRADQVIE